MKRSLSIILAIGCVISMSACATRWSGNDYFKKQPVGVEPDQQVSGEALLQRKETLRRLHRDLKSVKATAESLRRHRDLEGIASLEGFVHPYFEQQIEPLISDTGEWHAELQLLEANLLFAQAEVLYELRDARRLAKIARRIHNRFASSKSMLVEYPIGEQSTVQNALEDLEYKREIL
ncbi:MAG: hypothetical protein GY725_01130 [bacterium]|nr:hypothetical protein [bacterium]